MAKYEHVYSITNENLTAYQDLYNFSNARVLTVLGSGDQYLAALLYGAKDVEVFDANFLTWYFFNLKIAAIKVLSYEEFFHFFIESELSDMDYYLKIRDHLTNFFRNFFDQFIRVNGSIKKLCHSSILYKGPKSLEDNSIIPYFTKEEYYRLREILNYRKLPNFYTTNILELGKYAKGNYDLMLFSNIYVYLFMSVEKFKQLLDSFKCDTIQANYLWSQNIDATDFVNAGFIKDLVPPVNGCDEITSNVVLTYKKRK